VPGEGVLSVGADADAEALFVSTGLRTTPLVAGMEAKPASRWSPATKRSPGTASDSAA
jgi:hypothetical protein